MRKQPDPKLTEAIDAHWKKGKQPKETVTWVRKYKLITPLFGGGVSPMECDPVTIIRGTEIRGHLRFWWRATRGGQYNSDSSKMKEAEAKIWGAAHISKKATTPSEKKDDEPELPTVQIEVKINKDGTSEEVFAYVRDRAGKIERDGKERPNIKQGDNSIPAYAVFPLRPTDEEREKERKAFKAGREGEGIIFKKVQKDSEFTLTITFATEHEQDIRAALWAWETFGGVGARTRRGFGAIQLLESHIITKNGDLEKKVAEPVELPPSDRPSAEKWVKDRLQEHIKKQNFPNNVPHLSPDAKPCMIAAEEHAPSVWKLLIDTLKDFRQKRFTSTKPNAKHPGRSRWPEPSAIRHFTGQSLPAHENPIPETLINKFPRAAFGLPIIFKFKDSKKYQPDDRKSDPRKTILQLEKFERFASPLILKPLACKDNVYIGLATILEGSKVENEQLLLKAQEGQKYEENVESVLKEGDFILIPKDNPPPIRIDSRTNAVQAFLKYLQGATK